MSEYPFYGNRKSNKYHTAKAEDKTHIKESKWCFNVKAPNAKG